MSEQNTLKNASWTPDTLTLEWVDGGRIEFPSLWLRDNCPSNRDSRNGQRLIDVADLPPDPKIHAASPQQEFILIEWENELRPASFDLQWLRKNALEPLHEKPEPAARFWLEGAKLDAAQDFAWSELSEFRGLASVRRNWMTRLIQDGIAFLTDVPCTHEAVLEVVEHIGIIHETNYGRVFNVQFLPRPENLADSDLGLGLHTDNPYRDPVPGFQTLHFLIASPEGGESLFADGFAIAEHLRGTEPALFERLTRTPVAFAFRSKDADLRSERPLIQLSHRGDIKAIHYNNRSIAPLRLETSEIAPFYAAYRRFAELLRDPAFQLKIKLNDGQLVAFDNQRILHGRTGFASAKYPRHLQGCYLTRDSVLSQAAVLRRQIASEKRT
jgi:alpha-ketoglutarate-dependent taurine dioxygenase